MMRVLPAVKWSTRIAAIVVLSMVAAGGPSRPAAAFHDVTDGAITVYQPGGLEPEVVGAAMDAAGRTGAAWTPVHTGTLKLVSITRGDETIQAPAPGFRIPMSAMAIDADRAEPVTGLQVANALKGRFAVMGAATAALRGARPGDVIEFIGWDNVVHRRVVGLVVPDEQINWAELAFEAEDAASFGFERVSSLLLWDLEHRDEAIIELWRSLPQLRLRVDSSDDPWNPDSPLPTVLVKQRFGEFAYRETGSGDQIQVDRAWRNENIIDVDLPILGPFRCHRAIVPLLEAAMNEVIEAGLAGQISSSDFQLAGGCWNPRLIRGGDKGGALSRHAWGVAVDINPTRNPYGGVVDMHPEIVEIFRALGFAWGGGWTFTDGGHFEWNHESDASTTPPELAGS
ncbi:MAG: M15 family metallopeptidase [Acidimicrobiia bacterium]|nr:M15 family metallopeptidase [Acidimicrobiia bacterium]